MKGPLQIERDSMNTLRIVDPAGEEVCQFYTDADTIDEKLLQKAEFVLRACNELLRKENGT